MGKKQRRFVYKNIALKELSNVDNPMQEDAESVIIKRVGDAGAQDAAVTENIAKQSFLEALKARKLDEEVRNLLEPLWDYNSELRRSFHRIIDDAEITDKKAAMSETLGQYTEVVSAMISGVQNKIDVAAVIKRFSKPETHEGGTTMTPEEIAKMKEDNERLQLIAKLSAEHKTFYDGLSTDEAKEDFLTKSADDRATDITKAAAADEELVVGTSVVKRSVVGNVAFEMIKSNNALLESEKAKTAALEKKAATEAFEKRATDEFPNLPGDAVLKGKILAEASKMPADVKAGLEAILKSANKFIKEGAHTEQKPEGEGQTQTDLKKKAQDDTADYIKKKYKLKDE